MRRREFLGGLSALALSGCTQRARLVAPARPIAPFHLAPIRASMDRVFRITVCSRPFRAAGPRLDVERVGEKTVVHNYGHGGSGWSLSWGSSAIAVEKALATGERDIAVIGCGALGLTSATLLQQAGAKVTIYAKERPPAVRSSRATGSWTPDSRIALANSVSADFPALWEQMARKSFHTYESYLGVAGNPVEWTDRYLLTDPGQPAPAPGRQVPVQPGGAELEFGRYSNRIADLTPQHQDLPSGHHPFPTRFARRNSSLTFNIAAYSRQLVTDFLIEGGKIEITEFHAPSELSRIPQKTIVNATGYGARALWNDQSVVPVRGQIAWLIPEPEATYGVWYKGVQILARRDGIVVQQLAGGDMFGYNDASETPDRAEAEAAVETAAELFRRMSETATPAAASASAP